MFIASLIAQPGGLQPALIDSLRNAWGGGDVVWLSPDEAAEFQVSALPDNRWDVWADLQKMNVDLVVHPSDGRQKRMLLADMDSTMIQQECIDELAEMAGVGDEVKNITMLAMNGELDFEGALRARVALMKGLNAKVIDQVLSERITYTPGGSTLLATMKARGGYTALVSGGFTAFTKAVSAHLGFDENRANVLHIEDGMLAGTAAEPILGRQAKIEALKEISSRLGISEQDVLAVGDGANDLGMLDLAGMGVALHAKPAVAAQSEIRINHGDLTALLYLQGYSRDEFVA
ncbi:MAG: phosphoserine phosphatase SerB [Pseudomonadota bacterium]